MTASTEQPLPSKKEPYTGDPNTPFTMCYKKARRHSLRDAARYVGTNVETGKEQDLIICKHCKQWLFKDTDAKAA